MYIINVVAIYALVMIMFVLLATAALVALIVGVELMASWLR